MTLDDQARILSTLNLTINQAKVYLTIANLTIATASKIAKDSNLPRDEVYRAIPRLQDFGLIETIIGNPTGYKSQPLGDGIRLLLNRKNEEERKAHQEIETLVKHYDNLSPKAATQEEIGNKFSLVQGPLYLQKTIQTHYNASKTIDVITSFSRFIRQGDSFIEPTMNSLKRGVAVRAIINIETEKDNLQLNDILIKLSDKIKDPKSKYLGFRKNYTQENIELVIYDNKYVFLGTGASKDTKDHNLFSDNVNLAKLAVHYFEDLWLKAQSNEIELTEKQIAASD